MAASPAVVVVVVFVFLRFLPLRPLRESFRRADVVCVVGFGGEPVVGAASVGLGGEAVLGDLAVAVPLDVGTFVVLDAPELAALMADFTGSRIGREFPAVGHDVMVGDGIEEEVVLDLVVLRAAEDELAVGLARGDRRREGRRSVVSRLGGRQRHVRGEGNFEVLRDRHDAAVLVDVVLVAEGRRAREVQNVRKSHHPERKRLEGPLDRPDDPDLRVRHARHRVLLVVEGPGPLVGPLLPLRRRRRRRHRREEPQHDRLHLLVVFR
mmetsp:Transcript_23640/g.75879  ORF Transcript_23640/g.75879 Transcript_23640/m.75879 type:complete len:266 (-) Transcript_23640:301-1098(-)